jgi:membrane-bound lytic murein transglycosylase A
MESIRYWLGEDFGRAADLMRRNRSFIFFRLVEDSDPDHGPLGAASVPLTAGRSLAIDDTLYTYGMPVWISTTKPFARQIAPFRRLMIAQDTGSAIRGPARGDIFIGSGLEAGMIAGAIRHECEFVVFFPAAAARRSTR